MESRASTPAVEPLGFAVVLAAGARQRLTARTYDCPAEESARVRTTAGAI